MILVSSCSCLSPVHWNQGLNRQRRCSWSSADRRCSNYIWVVNDYIPYTVRLILENWRYFIPMTATNNADIHHIPHSPTYQHSKKPIIPAMFHMLLVSWHLLRCASAINCKCGRSLSSTNTNLSPWPRRIMQIYTPIPHSPTHQRIKKPFAPTMFHMLDHDIYNAVYN